MGHIRLLCSFVFATALAACGNSLEGDLVGTWNVREVRDGVELVYFLELLPDHTSRLHIRTAYKDVSADATGKWFLNGTTLTIKNDSEGTTSTTEVIKVDERMLITRDIDPPGNSIDQMTRHTGPIPTDVAASVVESSKPTPSGTPGSGKVATAPEAASAPKATAQSARQFIDDYSLVESKDVRQYQFTLQQARRIQVVLDIEDNTPIDVMLLSAKAAQKYDSMKGAVVANETDKVVDMLGTMFGKEEADKFKTGSKFTEADFYNRPMSHKAAHRHYETEGILAAGEYVLFLDNSGDITKTLGDASVHLQVFDRDLN